MVMTHTYVKTFAIYNAWAQTFPWECRVRDTGCCSPTHDHSPMVGDICAEPQCSEPLKAGEVCYAVTELKRRHDREQWVCWRHVHPDREPVKI